MALRVTLAAAAVTTLVCAPAAWADTFMLGGTGTVGAPTQRAMAFLINDRIVEPDTLGDPTNSDGGLMAKLPGWYLPVLDFSFTPPAVDTPYRDLEQGPQPGVRRTRAPESNIRETPIPHPGGRVETNDRLEATYARPRAVRTRQRGMYVLEHLDDLQVSGAIGDYRLAGRHHAGIRGRMK